MKYIFGAFGTNNVGDEAIFEGANKLYPDLIEIYVNKSYRPNSVWYADLLEGKETFNEDADELIIGGGGLIHCKNAVVDYIKMATLAKAKGMRVSIQRVGFEGITFEFAEEVRQLLSVADSISVRSSESQRIVNSLGYGATVDKDFAYLLPVLSSSTSSTQIGVSIGSLGDTDFPHMVSLMRILLKYSDVLFIPHSRSWVSYNNNDIITGHKIWSKLDLWHPSVKHFLTVLPYVPTPKEALRIYANQVKGVFSNRYHGCIFADMTRRSLFIPQSGRKLDSFIEDCRSNLVTLGEAAVEARLEAWVKSLVETP